MMWSLRMLPVWCLGKAENALPSCRSLEELQMLGSWLIWKKWLKRVVFCVLFVWFLFVGLFFGFFCFCFLIFCLVKDSPLFYVLNLHWIFLPKDNNPKKSVAINTTADLYSFVFACMCVCEHMYVCVFGVLHCVSESTFVGDARVAMVVTYF